MIVRDLADAQTGGRRVKEEHWESARLLLDSDRMGFSLHVTKLQAGAITPMWPRNHLEAVLCIGGEGEVETLDDGKVYPVRPGVLYAVDQHDKHVLRARTELRMVCVFNPPLKGKETLGPDGAYRLEAGEIEA